MKELFDLLTEDEKMRVTSIPYQSIDFDMFDYILLTNHFEELSFDQYAKLRELSRIDSIREKLDSVLSLLDERMQL